eukprot:CFRG2552T1
MAESYGNVSDTVAQLLQDTQLSTGKDEKLKLLNQVNELLLKKEPKLLSNFLPEIIQFQSDAVADVRKWLIVFLEQACKISMEEALPDTLDVLEYRLHDDALPVVKKAISCNAVLHQMTFSWMCRISVEKAEASVDLWDQLVTMKDIICERLTTTDNVGVKSTAVKFVEMIVLLYSHKSADSENRPKLNIPSVDRVPITHPVLKQDQLTAEAGHLVELLMSTSQTESNVTYLVVVIAALGSIAKQRPYQHFITVATGLNDLADTLVFRDVTDSQRESLLKALKTQIMGLLRHPTASTAGELTERMAKVLVQQLDVKKAEVEKLYRQTMSENLRMTSGSPSIFDSSTTNADNMRESSRNATEERGIKRERVDVDLKVQESETSHNQHQSDPRVKKPRVMNVVDQDVKKKKVLSEKEAMLARLQAESVLCEGKLTMLTQLTALEPTMLRELVLLALPKLPPIAPASFNFVPAELEKNCKQILSTAKDMRDPRKMSSLVLPSSLVAQFAPKTAIKEEATAAPVSTSASTTSVSAKQQTNGVIVPSATPASGTLRKKKSESETVKKQPKVQKAIRKGPFVLKPLKMDEESRKRMAVQAFVRILDNEPQLMMAGLNHKRIALIVKMASMTTRLSQKLPVVKQEGGTSIENIQNPEEDPFASALLQHILVDVKRGFELLLIWLYQEYRNADLVAVYVSDTSTQIAPLTKDTKDMDVDKKELEMKSETHMPAKIGGHISNMSVYARFDYFLEQAVEACKEKLTPKDRLFTRLILEAPRITPRVLEIVKEYCHSLEYSMLGVATLRDLIVHRVPDRLRALQLLLECTNSPDAEVSRTNAIINVKKIYSTHEVLRDPIESFAIDNFRELLKETPSPSIYVPPPTTTKPTAEEGADASVAMEATKPTVDVYQSAAVNGSPQWNEASIELCCLLYYALCVTNTSLLGGVFALYSQCSSKVVQAGIRKNIDTLVRHIGAENKDLQTVVDDYPEGADHLVLKVLQIVTRATKKDTPLSPALVDIVREKFKVKKNIHFLIQVLGGLTKDEIISNLGAMLSVGEVVTKDVLDRLLASYAVGGTGSGPISPADLLIAIHELRPTNKTSQKNFIFAHRYCFQKKDVYSPEVLGVAIQQMVDTVPLSQLLMSTVINSVAAYPKMQDFVLSILTRLISKGIWNSGQSLWKGWIKCSTLPQMQPQSYAVLLQLPQRQLGEILDQQPDLQDALVEYVKGLPILQQNQVPRDIRRTLSIKT